MEIFGVPPQLILGQVLIGLINGSFYALLSLGLAIIFGLLRVINFAHGALYMMGAFAAWMTQAWLGLNFWAALVVAPLAVGLFGLVVERAFLRSVYHLDHLYGLLLTFGIALMVEGMYRYWFGAAGKPFTAPHVFSGIWDLGFVIVPKYRGFVVLASLVTCLAVWLLIERTRLGSYLRAATENPDLVSCFGINVSLLTASAYVLGAALAGLSGVLAAPIYQVTPLMGTNLIIVVFAVVVTGGMGSLSGAIITGYGMGVIEGLTKVFYPAASSVVIFVVMALMLLLRPAGLFGKEV